MARRKKSRKSLACSMKRHGPGGKSVCKCGNKYAKKSACRR